MNLPTHEELLANVDKRFRELAPSAPRHLDPNDSSHEAMIRQWWQAHHEVLSTMTDEAFFAYFPNAPERLDPGNSDHATMIEYWKDIANQINGETGKYDWSKADVPEVRDEIEMPVQDGSVELQDRIDYVLLLMKGYADAVAATPLGPKVVDHTMRQIDMLRGLVKDGTFQHFDHWLRSASFSEAIYDEENRDEQVAFVRDLTLEAKIDRTTGVLDTHLSGWASDLKRHEGFGRESRAGA